MTNRNPDISHNLDPWNRWEPDNVAAGHFSAGGILAAELPGSEDGTDTVPEGTDRAGDAICRHCRGAGKLGDEIRPICQGSGRVIVPIGGA